MNYSTGQAGGNIGVLPRSRRTPKMQGQAAGLNSLVALALMGSTVSVATHWVNSVSALVLAVKVSNCWRAWEVHSSIASEGDFTPNRECAKSRLADVFALMILISLAGYSLGALLGGVETASMVPLWLSAKSLNLAKLSRACETPFSAKARTCSGTSNGITEEEKGSEGLVMACIFRKQGENVTPTLTANKLRTRTWILRRLGHGNALRQATTSKHSYHVTFVHTHRNPKAEYDLKG